MALLALALCVAGCAAAAGAAQATTLLFGYTGGELTFTVQPR